MRHCMGTLPATILLLWLMKTLRDFERRFWAGRLGRLNFLLHRIFRAENCPNCDAIIVAPQWMCALIWLFLIFVNVGQLSCFTVNGIMLRITAPLKPSPVLSTVCDSDHTYLPFASQSNLLSGFPHVPFFTCSGPSPLILFLTKQHLFCQPDEVAV